MSKDKSGRTIPISYEEVERAYRKVKQGGKASGIDGQSWQDFDKEASKHLYVIYNRMSSGSYHPKAVREVEIPKAGGKKRKLGIPTLRDRIAQEVVKARVEGGIDAKFHEQSYGYRPMKSAHDALNQVRQNCYKWDWVLDMDIQSFFDELDHELLLKALEHVGAEKWEQMYVKRWLEAPVEKADGTLEARNGKGTPQGGVISPLLANLYLHYSLDKWLEKYYPEVSFVRYADDIIIHCRSKAEAEGVLQSVRERMKEVKLRLNEAKTRIVYCKDYRRKEAAEAVQFDFLGFSFQPRGRESKNGGGLFLAFTAEISQKGQKRLREAIRSEGIWRNTSVELEDIAKRLNPKLRGWVNYYGIYSKRVLRRNLLQVDYRLLKWMRKKYKLNYRKAVARLTARKQQNPELFYHWKMGY